ncbi:MAG: hypothetical protein K6F35_12680 [Lachnospiraceae bacterium]|nr:hypothetical protein [Lachnospiraceae bacterium]
MSDIKINRKELRPGFWEFDYTKNGKRVRKKLECTHKQADLLVTLLNEVINRDTDEEQISFIIDAENLYARDRLFLRDAIYGLAFSNSTLEDTPAETRRAFMREFLPIEDDDMVVSLLGKAGVGKSTIIQKMSALYGSEIKIPFTDSSRTTTYTADYRFVKEKPEYRFIATLRPIEEIDVSIQESIDRAVGRYFEGKIKEEDIDKLHDGVLRSFVRDSKNLFDLRYSIGRYRRHSKNGEDLEIRSQCVYDWEDIYGMIRGMCDDILGEEFGDDLIFYNNKFSEIMRDEASSKEVHKRYNDLMDFIHHLIEKSEKAIKAKYKNSPAFEELVFDDENSCIYGKIKNMESSDTRNFLQTLTAKEAEHWGDSLLIRIEHLRIEIPYHQAVKLPREDFTFVMCDSIGIAHNKNETGGFEDSTNLGLDGVDAILLVDDSRLNGDNNFTTIFEHIVSRVEPAKIFYAYTFFDDFTKEDLEDDEDKIEYLIDNTKAAITNSMQGNLFNERKYQILTSRLNDSESFFLAGLMDAERFDSLNSMLQVLAEYKLTKNGALDHYLTGSPIVDYDYKKIPLLYQMAVTDYYGQQDDIYDKNPPHFKTTEALTRRLGAGQSYFDGARLLKPVDDFYNCVITTLSPYIDHPEVINFACTEDGNMEEVTEHILGKIRTQVTEKLRKYVNDRFLSEKAKDVWSALYLEKGVGTDLRRRQGILREEKYLGSNVDEYLRSTRAEDPEKNAEHMINIIERVIRDAVEYVTDDENSSEAKPLFETGHRKRIM